MNIYIFFLNIHKYCLELNTIIIKYCLALNTISEKSKSFLFFIFKNQQTGAIITYL